MLGCHAIKHWSSTQSSVALSSGEAEFAGVIRGAGQGLGYQALLRDFGIATSLRVWTDSSAAIGICNRQGLGKLRHLDTHTLWTQQAVRLGRVDLGKVAGEANPADLFTKHSLSRQRMEMLVELHGCKYLGGRAATAPQAKTGASNKTTMASEGGAVNAMNAEIVETVSAEGSEVPEMPHLTLSPEELDRQFPSISTTPHEQLDDIVDDANDLVLQNGIRIADEIRHGMMTQGRTRRRDQDDEVGTVLYPSAHRSTGPSSLEAGAGVRQQPEVIGTALYPSALSHQVSSTPIFHRRACRTPPPSCGGLLTCTGEARERARKQWINTRRSYA